MNIRKEYLDTTARSRPGTKITPKGLVIHWTANQKKGAKAINNRNYFNDSGQAVSAHYVADDTEIVQCLPENEMAYHVGAKMYKKEALQQLSSYPNNCTIGIEMCVNVDGDFTKTYQNTVQLAADILKRYGWTINQLWRHYDITGKDCPRFFVDDAIAKHFGFTSAADGWKQFKIDVNNLKEGVKPMASKTNNTPSAWAKEAWEWCLKQEYLDGTRPQDPVTREELAVILQRLKGGK